MSVLTLPGPDAPKTFERLCADILAAEHFAIEHEVSVDRSGEDLVATEEYHSHTQVRSITIRWRVQCKYYSGSGRNLGRKEVEEAIFHFEAVRRPNEGLLLAVSTDCTEEATRVIDEYTTGRNARVTVWNGRQLRTLLSSHPHLEARYGLPTARIDISYIFETLRNFNKARVLIISDQSALAHDLTSALRKTGFDVTFIPFWHYVTPGRTELLPQWLALEEGDFSLILCFLGDSFSFPFPPAISNAIREHHARGARILFFPFLAWAINRGLNLDLGENMPVRLEDPSKSSPPDFARVAGAFRHGDFSWLLKYDSFAENRYVELDPRDGKYPFTEGIERRFGLTHSFEYLKVCRSGEAVWRDTTGNPFIVIDSTGPARVCYLNTCCHSCMTPLAIPSPFDVGLEPALLVRNVIRWLLEG